MLRYDQEMAAVIEAHAAHRHRCEVRLLLNRRVEQGDWDSVETHLALAGKRRGQAARDALAADIKRQWRLGNRGQGWVEAQ